VEAGEGDQKQKGVDGRTEGRGCVRNGLHPGGLSRKDSRVAHAKGRADKKGKNGTSRMRRSVPIGKKKHGITR